MILLMILMKQKNPNIMKYEYVTSDKLKKSLKKKNKSDFENQLRVIAAGVTPYIEFNNDNKELIVNKAIEDTLISASRYVSDGNSMFIYFKDLLKSNITKQLN